MLKSNLSFFKSTENTQTLNSSLVKAIQSRSLSTDIADRVFQTFDSCVLPQKVLLENFFNQIFGMSVTQFKDFANSKHCQLQNAKSKLAFGL